MNNKFSKINYKKYFILLYSNLQQPYHRQLKTLKISKGNAIFHFYKNFSYIFTVKIQIITY